MVLGNTNNFSTVRESDYGERESVYKSANTRKKTDDEGGLKIDSKKMKNAKNVCK